MSEEAGLQWPEVAVTKLRNQFSLFAVWVPRMSNLAASTFTHWNLLAGPQALFFIYLKFLLRDWREETADIQVTLRESVLNCKPLGAWSER